MMRIQALRHIGQAFIGMKAFSALGHSVAEALSSFTEPAASLENAAASLGVMLGDNSASGMDWPMATAPHAARGAPRLSAPG